MKSIDIEIAILSWFFALFVVLFLLLEALDWYLWERYSKWRKLTDNKVFDYIFKQLEKKG